MLDITVCIMSYNRLVFLREAIASVLAQSRQPRHIIVYDNGSDDTVRSGVQDYSERGIQWRGAEANQPFIWNFQRALSNCTSKYILMLHDDDRLCTDFLYLQTQLLDAHDDIAAVSCNGYFIDGSGTRTGNMLSQAVDGKPVHFFNYSGQIALRYAEGSCIPFSPTIYRTDMAMRVKPRSDLGKVFDAAYFCDLLQFGRIAFQTRPLYESRLHIGQDSGYFPIELMDRLGKYFLTREFANDQEVARLYQLLQVQRTTWFIRQVFNHVRNLQFLALIAVFRDKTWQFRSAVKIIFTWCIGHAVRRLEKLRIG